MVNDLYQEGVENQPQEKKSVRVTSDVPTPLYLQFQAWCIKNGFRTNKGILTLIEMAFGSELKGATKDE